MISEQLREQVYSCIKCGLCMNTCPVYRQLYFEGASPRGKVQLIKKILEGELEISAYFSSLLHTCLLCETCTVNCPSGVDLNRLMKAARAEVVRKLGLPLEKLALYSLLSRNRLLPFFMFWGRTLETPLRSLLLKEGRAGTIPATRLPRLNSRPLLDQYPQIVSPAGPRVGRVLYFVGCATNYLFENVGRAVITTLNSMGIEVIIPRAQVCCGFPAGQAGMRKIALRNIRQNLELFDPGDADAVVVDCATCGTALKKEYANILEEMGENAEAARRLGQKVQDISEYLSKLDPAKYLKPVRGRVTYHDPCHLLRSQGIKEPPRNLLKSIPDMEFVEMAGADVCCGGGGAFQFDHPDVAAGITKNKVQAIMETGAHFVATGCPGCRLQIHGSLGDESIKVVHPVELLALAIS